MTNSIDRKAFRALSSGLYVISSVDHTGRLCGCIANTLLQVASEPAQLLVSLNKQNATTTAITDSERFCASVLSKEADMSLIGTFGFTTSLTTEKFTDFDHDITNQGLPQLTQDIISVFDVRVDSMIDVGTHIVFIGTVEQARVIGEEQPLTYEYYHRVLRGKTPSKAATYNEGDDSTLDAPSLPADEFKEETIAWRCKLCGFTVEGFPDGLPEDFRCPMCGASRDMFEKIII